MLDLVTGRHFQYGALFGVAGVLLSYALRRHRPDWGLLWSGAVVAAFVVLGGLRFRFDDATDLFWLVLAFGAAAVATTTVLRLAEEFVVGPGLAISLAGIWATVPDTEKMAVLLGATAVMIWGWSFTRWAQPRLLGAVGIGILVALSATSGGLGRTTGMIGAIGSLATLGLSGWALPITRPVIWLTGHTVLVLVWSRWAGLAETPVAALAIGGVTSALVVMVGFLIGPRVELEPTGG